MNPFGFFAGERCACTNAAPKSRTQNFRGKTPWAICRTEFICKLWTLAGDIEMMVPELPKPHRRIQDDVMGMGALLGFETALFWLWWSQRKLHLPKQFPGGWEWKQSPCREPETQSMH